MLSSKDDQGYNTVAEALQRRRSHVEAHAPGLADVAGPGNVTGTKSWYAVAKGKEPGVYTEWPVCPSQIRGFRGHKYKKFETREEAVQSVRDNR